MNRVRQILLMAGAAWVAALLAAGCTKEGRPATGWEADPDAVRIEASVGMVTKSNPLGSAEEQAKFSKGDKITVIQNAKNLVNYVFDGTSWAPEGEDYLTWQTDAENTFRLQYPYIGHESDFGEFFKDQSTLEKMTRSDLMEAEKVEYTKIPGNKILSAALKRKRSLVTVVIAGFGDELSSEDAKVTDLKLHLWDGGQGDEIITVTPFIRDAQGVAQPAGTAGLVGYSYTAIGRNDCKYSGKSFITMTVADKSLTVANPADMVAGKHYTYKLIVGKQTVKIGGVTVEDWTTGKLDGKFEAEVDNYSEWDGKKVSSGYTFSGEGTSDKPWRITSATDLAGLAANVNSGTNYHGKYFRLEANIDLMGHEWTPIGNSSSKFEGIFDGNNKIITNMSITAAPSSDSGVGLFGNCSGASVSNVVLKNAKITYSGEIGLYSGLICGVFSGAVKNCRVDGTISAKRECCGGIIGKANGGTSVSDCDVEIHGESPWGYTGGIVGYFHEDAQLTIESCVVKGEINGGNSGFGGIAGSLQGNNVLVKNCTSYARLGKATDGTTPKVGGLVGGFTYGKAESCTVYGSISFTYDSGIVGGMFSNAYDVTLSNLNFRGDIDVTIQGESYSETTIGAFIAWLSGTATTATGCTYKKSGTGGYHVVGKFGEDNFDETKLDITGI